MQFVTHGPDIPDALLQAHEEGRVVFFCGAGISYPAGLPGFQGLVEQIYRLNGTDFSDIERAAFERGQFDATLDLLERRLPGQRQAVRSKLAQALQPKLRRTGATDTQAALLRLARSREGALRLVTTNFDRLFHVAAKRTGQALQAYAAPLVQIMPDAVLQEIDHAATWWMEVASKSINRHEDILLNLCRRVLALPMDADTGMTHNGEPIDQPVTEAINHPVGHVTQALINLWFKQNPNDNDLLPANLKPLFTALCDVQVDRFRHGRVLLGSRLIALFRVDRPWTEQYLLPLLDWNNPAEAKTVWEGFLWSPRLYQPLLTAFKSQFLDSANHYADLGGHRQQFAGFLTYAALGPAEGYAADEFRAAFAALPPDGLEESARVLSQALEGAAEQREDYWKNRIQPFWQQIWPKSRDLVTQSIAASLVRLAIAARGEFPAALAMVQDWIRSSGGADRKVRLLHESGLCSRFPADALLLLNAVVTEQQWLPRELGQCLDEIEQAAPQLVQDARYLRLREYSRGRGI